MNKKMCTLTLTTFLLFLFTTAIGQLAIDKYYTVTLKGDVVRGTLESYPNFSYFDFSYQQMDNEVYSLSVLAKDENDNQLGGVINLTPMTSQPVRKFKNLEKGHLILSLATMQSHDVDGSEDYVLTPRKCKNHSGEYVDYVSYRFSNKAEDSFGFLPAKSVTAVKSFNLNPSPPY